MTYIDNWIEDVLDSELSDIEGLKNRIAQKIDSLLARSDMTKSDFARELGVKPPYVTKLLRGDANVSLKTLVKIARACDSEVQIEFIPENSGCSSHDWEQLSKKRSTRGHNFELSDTNKWFHHSFAAGE